jgi:hypothetical protein
MSVTKADGVKSPTSRFAGGRSLNPMWKHDACEALARLEDVRKEIHWDDIQDAHLMRSAFSMAEIDCARRLAPVLSRTGGACRLMLHILAHDSADSLRAGICHAAERRCSDLLGAISEMEDLIMPTLDPPSCTSLLRHIDGAHWIDRFWHFRLCRRIRRACSGSG